MDLDTVHAIFQYPVAVLELTVAVAMFARWQWARSRDVKPAIDGVVTLLLASFLLAIGVKQAFWAVWGALQAHDLLSVAADVRNHWWPVVNNACITVVGVALLGRIGAAVYGRAAHVAAGVSGAALVCVGAYVATYGG